MNQNEVLYDAQGKAIGLVRELEETSVGSSRAVTAYYGNGKYAGEYRVPSFNTPSALNTAVSESLGGCLGSLFVWLFLIWIFLAWNMHRAMWKYLKKGRIITVVVLFLIVWMRLDWIFSILSVNTDTLFASSLTGALSNIDTGGSIISIPTLSYLIFMMRGLIWVLLKIGIMAYLIIVHRIHI